jgi:hypothetical protein
MSSAVVSTSAATGRLFVFDEEAVPGVRSLSSPSRRESAAIQESSIVRFFQSTISNQQSAIDSMGNRKSAIGNSVIPASRLAIRPAPEMVSSGIPALDALTGGLPRGCLTEICGPVSSGRTSLLLAALAAATRRGEFCTVVDASDALDPQSAAAAGVELERLLWVRCGEESPQRTNSPQRHRDTEKRRNEEERGCPTLVPRFLRDRVGISQKLEIGKENSRASEHRLEQVLRATDLLLESGGFGLIVLDLGDLRPQAARRIPLTTWFRFRRAIEHTPTMLVVIEQQPIVGSCSSLLLQLSVPSTQYSVPSSEQTFLTPSHSHLLTGWEINTEVIRSRFERKPARSVTFAAKTAWAG